MVGRAGEHSGMRHRTDRTFVPGNFGIVRVNVDCLDKAGEGNQQHTQQRKDSELWVVRSRVLQISQKKRPTPDGYPGYITLDAAMHALIAELSTLVTTTRTILGGAWSGRG